MTTLPLNAACFLLVGMECEPLFPDCKASREGMRPV
jgi:hypothetical protein